MPTMLRRSLRFLLLLSVIVGLFASNASALGVGARAPDINLVDLSGKLVTLGDLKGKVVLVDFWASWCAPCREELPVLEALHKKYRAQGLVVVGVNADSDQANMQKFLRRTPLGFTVVHDGKREVAGRYAPPKMPSSYLIDRKGLVRHVQAGFKASDAADLENHVKALLAQ